MEDLLTLEVESVSDDHVPELQRGNSGLSEDGHLQVFTCRLRDGFGNSSLVQVHVLCHRVYDDVGLWTKITADSSCHEIIYEFRNENRSKYVNYVLSSFYRTVQQTTQHV